MKKILCLLVILSCLVPMAFAGGQAEEGGAKQYTITIQDYLMRDVHEAMFGNLFANFQKEYPNVSFERNSLPFGELHQRILTQAMAKDLPDILMVNNFDIPYIADAGALRRLNEMVDAWGQWDDFYPGSQDATTWKGDIVSFHAGTNNLAFFYNPDIFREAGLNEPPVTWDEMLMYAEKLTQGDRYGMAVSAVNTEELPWQLKPFLWTNGGDMMSLDKPESIEALQLWVTLIENGWMSRDVVNWGQGDVTAQYKAKKAAMIVMGPWEIPGLQADDYSFEIITTPTPKPGMIPKVAMGGETWGLSPYIEDQKADVCFEFIKTMVSKDGMYEYCEISGYVPTRKSLVKGYVEENPIMKPFVDQLPQATRSDPEKRLDYKDISTAARAYMQKALIGEMSAEAAMKEAAAEIREITQD